MGGGEENSDASGRWGRMLEANGRKKWKAKKHFEVGRGGVRRRRARVLQAKSWGREFRKRKREGGGVDFNEKDPERAR